jgi:hypothetical protein
MKLVSFALRRPDLAFNYGHSDRIGQVRGARSNDGVGSLVYTITDNGITRLSITNGLADVTESPFDSEARGANSSPSKGDHLMNSLAPSKVTPTPGHGPSGRQNRWVTGFAKFVGAAAFVLLASTHAFAGAVVSAPLLAEEHHACAVVMGLQQPGDLYDTCIRSLDKSLFELGQSRLVQSDRTACAQRGLKPGTSGFAVCVVNAEQARADIGHY